MKILTTCLLRQGNEDGSSYATESTILMRFKDQL